MKWNKSTLKPEAIRFLLAITEALSQTTAPNRETVFYLKYQCKSRLTRVARVLTQARYITHSHEANRKRD